MRNPGNISKYPLEWYAFFFGGSLSLITIILLPNSLLTDFVNLFFILVLPGWSIVRLWKEGIPYYEKFLYAVGLSLVILFACGLFLNTLLPLFGATRPLEIVIVKPTIWMLVTLISLFSLKQKKITLRHLSISLHQRILLMIGFLIPLIVIGGANRLNAFSEDWVATFALLAIMLYAIAVVWFLYKKQSQTFVPIHIFLISLSLLWMYSLRSHYIFGFDINAEFHFFTQTLQSAKWTSSHNPYGACLSITVLPTLITNYSNIAAESIFKVVYPALFSLVPVAIYTIGRRYFSSLASYLGCLLCIFQVHFLFQATALARQEIAILFLSIALVAFFNDKWSLKKRKVIFLLFSFGMILSHYSTTYIAVVGYLLTFAMISAYVYSRSKPLPKYHISGAILTIIVFGVIGWNLQMTQSSTNLFLSIKQSFTSIPQIFQSDAQRSVVAQSILGNNQVSDNEATKSYIKLHRKINQSNLTSSVINIPVGGPNGGPGLLSLYFHTFIPTLIKVFVICSSVYLLFSRKKQLPITYRLLAISTLFIGAALVIIPNISLDYNVERLYQQSLILLAIPATYLMLRAAARLQTAGTILVVAVIFSYFLMTTSLIDKLFFHWSNVNIGNNSQDYYTFSATDGDYAAVRWVNVNNKNNYLVYGDRYGALRLIAFSNTMPAFNVRDDLLLGALTSHDYVYLDTTNLIYNRAYFQLNGRVFSFTVPQDLIANSKNTVYSNQKASIYR